MRCAADPAPQDPDRLVIGAFAMAGLLGLPLLLVPVVRLLEALLPFPDALFLVFYVSALLGLVTVPWAFAVAGLAGLARAVRRRHPARARALGRTAFVLGLVPGALLLTALILVGLVAGLGPFVNRIWA